ncbi:MAG: XRE family transcriptional regulator [Minicystis sp.]
MVSIGNLIRDRRDALGLRLEDVAARAHLPADKLAAFEENRGTVTAAAADRVAQVLAVDPSALREGRIEKRPAATLFFFQPAMFADFRDMEDRPKVIEALERAIALAGLGVLLGRPQSRRAEFAPEGPTPEAAKDGYRLAGQVRAAIGSETGPIVDMTRLLEEDFDILVRTEPLASATISALTVKDNVGGAAAVIVNTNNERRTNPSTTRVDLAHELSHVLFDPPGEGDLDLVVDQDRPGEKGQRERDGADSTVPELSEQRARAFAAELLLPAEGLRELLGKPRYVKSLDEAGALLGRVRDRYQTPIEITVNHLVNRDHLVHWLRQPVIDWARRHEPRPPSARPPNLAPPRPDLLERRVREALDRDLITDERARELLGLTPWDELPKTA